MAYVQDQELWGTARGTGTEREYISKPGDTLEVIAAFFYGDAVQRQRIIDDNPDWAGYQEGAGLPAGTVLKVGEDAERGDTISE